MFFIDWFVTNNWKVLKSERMDLNAGENSLKSSRMFLYHLLCFLFGFNVALTENKTIISKDFRGKVMIHDLMVLGDGISWLSESSNFTEFHYREKLRKFPAKCVPQFVGSKLMRICLRVEQVYYEWSDPVTVSKQVTCHSTKNCRVPSTIQIQQCSEIQPRPAYRLDLKSLLPKLDLNALRRGCVYSDSTIHATFPPRPLALYGSSRSTLCLSALLSMISLIFLLITLASCCACHSLLSHQVEL